MKSLTDSTNFLVSLVSKWFHDTSDTSRKLVSLVSPPFRVILVTLLALSCKGKTNQTFRRSALYLKTARGAIC